MQLTVTRDYSEEGVLQSCSVTSNRLVPFFPSWGDSGMVEVPMPEALGGLAGC